MKFAHLVKHNGIEYLPGQEVPIGVEPKKENALEDMSATKLSELLKERFGIDLPAQKGKKKLLEALDEAEKESLTSQDDSDLETEEDNEEDNLEGEEEESEDDTLTDPEDSSFANSIINDEDQE